MTVCPPVTVYTIFMAALVLYDVFYTKNSKQGLKSIAYLAVGAVLLWILCAADMQFAAWGLLAIPTVFYIFLIALVIFDQAFNLSSIYAKTEEECPKPEEEEPECEEEEPECEEEEPECEE